MCWVVKAKTADVGIFITASLPPDIFQDRVAPRLHCPSCLSSPPHPSGGCADLPPRPPSPNGEVLIRCRLSMMGPLPSAGGPSRQSWALGPNNIFRAIYVTKLFEVVFGAKWFLGGPGYQGRQTTHVQECNGFLALPPKAAKPNNHKFIEHVWFVGLGTPSPPIPVGQTTTSRSF